MNDNIKFFTMKCENVAFATSLWQIRKTYLRIFKSHNKWKSRCTLSENNFGPEPVRPLGQNELDDNRVDCAWDAPIWQIGRSSWDPKKNIHWLQYEMQESPSTLNTFVWRGTPWHTRNDMPVAFFSRALALLCWYIISRTRSSTILLRIGQNHWTLDSRGNKVQEKRRIETTTFDWLLCCEWNDTVELN